MASYSVSKKIKIEFFFIKCICKEIMKSKKACVYGKHRNPSTGRCKFETRNQCISSKKKYSSRVFRLASQLSLLKKKLAVKSRPNKKRTVKRAPKKRVSSSVSSLSSKSSGSKKTSSYFEKRKLSIEERKRQRQNNQAEKEEEYYKGLIARHQGKNKKISDRKILEVFKRADEDRKKDGIKGTSKPKKRIVPTFIRKI